jgi:hypothetical protein
MGKPGCDQNALIKFKELFYRFTKEAGLKQFLSYYLMAAHPGCGKNDMKKLRSFALKELGTVPEQVQDWKIWDAAAVGQALPCRIADTLADEALAKLIQQPRFSHPGSPADSRLAFGALDLVGTLPNSSSSRARPTRGWVRLRRPAHARALG